MVSVVALDSYRAQGRMQKHLRIQLLYRVALVLIDCEPPSRAYPRELAIGHLGSVYVGIVKFHKALWFG
jgi:hypothetical protein